MAFMPFQEGVFAAKVGAGFLKNPYRPGTDDHQLWVEGYQSSEAADQREADQGSAQSHPGPANPATSRP